MSDKTASPEEDVKDKAAARTIDGNATNSSAPPPRSSLSAPGSSLPPRPSGLSDRSPAKLPSLSELSAHKSPKLPSFPSMDKPNSPSNQEEPSESKAPSIPVPSSPPPPRKDKAPHEIIRPMRVIPLMSTPPPRGPTPQPPVNSPSGSSEPSVPALENSAASTPPTEELEQTATAKDSSPKAETEESPAVSPEDSTHTEATAETLPLDLADTAQGSLSETSVEQTHASAEGSSIEAEALEDDDLQEIEPTPAPPDIAQLAELEAPAPPRKTHAAIPEMVVPPTDRKPPPPRRSGKPSLPKVQQPRKKPWWETLFGDDFSRAYRPMTEPQLRREVDFILEQLNVAPGAVILDLGCGQGEVCVELARRGYAVVGYDLSVYQLAMAGDNAQRAQAKINFLQGDMREMAFEQMFDAVLCWDTTFGYFEEEKNLDVLTRIRNALKPNGRILIDVMNRDFAARETPYNHWFEGDGCVCMDDMNLDWITNRLRVKRSIILDDGRSKELQYSVRLYTLAELGRMLHDSGFRVSAVSGDVSTKGAFFGPHSPRIIISASKP